MNPVRIDRKRTPTQGGEPPLRLSGPPHASPPEGILSDITHLLVSETSPELVLGAVADALSELIPHDTLSLYRADPALRVLRPELVRDTHAAEILAMGSLPYGTGIAGAVAESEKPQLVQDTDLDPRAQFVDGTPREAEALIAIPLLARGDLKGVLSLYRLGEGNHFAENEFSLAIRFGELAALAIDNAEIRARLETEAVTDHLTTLNNHRYFHERLGTEMRRASRRRSPVSLLLYDIDDFKRVNDVYGHLVGDRVLQAVASITKDSCRREDVVCRIGGEEFGVILPDCELGDAVAAGERLRLAVEEASLPVIGSITVSVGVAQGPLHASSPRELVSHADLALFQAKADGKNRVRTPESAPPTESGGEPGAGYGVRGELRSAAHLRVLERLSARLNRLNEVGQIGEAITSELRSLIDYHNCRVHLLHADGVTLYPVAFRGELFEYRGETFDALVTKVGKGITGWVAEHGQAHYAPNALDDPYAVTIPGTVDVEESILAVPLIYADRTIGTLALSKLGLDQFDEEDQRLLEALAANAAVALENARLLQVEREEAEVSTSLLQLSQALTLAGHPRKVLREAILAIPSMLGCSTVLAWRRDGDSGAFRLIEHAGLPEPAWERLMAQSVSSEVANRFLRSTEEPFVVPKEIAATLPPGLIPFPAVTDVLVAPMRWERAGFGVLCILAPDTGSSFSERDLRLARGIADITSLALGTAQRFEELEWGYLSTVEALANAVEAKDAYTGNHCRALAEMSMAVGTEIGLPPDRLKVLELGALFHDIGKIGIPSDIIRKPGPLSAEERRVMSRHPEIGAQILEPVPFLQPVRAIIRASHERWDGRGYPDGLAETAIPIESRIVCVCDAFHAMVTDRPYRAGLSPKEAIRRLKISSGKQFDPDVVAALVRLHRADRLPDQ
ncbi:MAG: diguanylate cyclase [Actinobacteria bacterium]|nr:diguanylate cyclase [Actinomycetota bacterium]